jgi:hypothetical protein
VTVAGSTWLMGGFFMRGLSGFRAGRADDLAPSGCGRAFLVNATDPWHQERISAAHWRARRLARGRRIPSERLAVTATRRPTRMSRADMVNFAQGYAEVYSTLHCP